MWTERREEYQFYILMKADTFISQLLEPVNLELIIHTLHLGQTGVLSVT